MTDRARRRWQRWEQRIGEGVQEDLVLGAWLVFMLALLWTVVYQVL